MVTLIRCRGSGVGAYSGSIGILGWKFSRTPLFGAIRWSFYCLTTSPYPLPQRVLHRERSSASSFEFQYPFFSLRSSSAVLLLLSLPPNTFILPSIFPSKTVRCPVGVTEFLFAKTRPSRPWGEPSPVYNKYRE